MAVKDFGARWGRNEIVFKVELNDIGMSLNEHQTKNWLREEFDVIEEA